MSLVAFRFVSLRGNLKGWPNNHVRGCILEELLVIKSANVDKGGGGKAVIHKMRI